MPESGLADAPGAARSPGRTPRNLTGAAIGSIAIASPPLEVANAPIAERLGVDPDWITTRTGVRSRHVARAGENVVTLATEAANRSLAQAGIDAADIDLVIVATATHEELTPGASPKVAHAIGAANAGAIDINAACAGFVSALGLAAAQVEAGRAERVLVIGSEVLTRVLDPDDRTTAALFGDGAGAAIVGRVEGASRLGPMVIGADGAQSDLVRATRDEAILRMKGPDTFKQALKRLSEATTGAIEAAGATFDDVDLFVYHQANRRILTAVGDRLGLDPAKVVDCIAMHGNTSAASVAIALHEANVEGRLEPGTRVLVAALGGGLTWAAMLVEWGLGDEA